MIYIDKIRYEKRNLEISSDTKDVYSKKEVIEIYEIEAEDKYQAILEMHKKTDEEKEQFLIESEEFEEEEDISIDILTSEESK